MTEERKILRLTRKKAFDRFMVIAVKNGWKVSPAKVGYLLGARVFDASQKKFIPKLQFFSCCELPGGKSLKIIDEGNFERECRVAYSYRDSFGARDDKEVAPGDVILPGISAVMK